MEILIWCLLIATILPFIAKMPVAYAMNKLGRYDNNHPRAQQSQLTGFGARALAAHQNAFESLIVFSSAIIIAVATNTVSETTQALAITHVISRILYNLLYLYNKGTFRSIVWFVSLGCSISIISQCI